MRASSKLATVVLSVLLFGSSESSESGGVPAVESPSDVASVLDAWERRYATTTELDLYLRSTIAGPLPTVVHADTRIRFRAPSRWRIEMENSVGGRSQFLANGEELIRRTIRPGREPFDARFSDIHLFLASVVGVSVGGFGDAAALVVEMVGADELLANGNLVIVKASAARLPDEVVRDQECFVVAGKAPGSNHDVKLWIDRESFELHRYSVAKGRQLIVVDILKRDPDDLTAQGTPAIGAMRCEALRSAYDETAKPGWCRPAPTGGHAASTCRTPAVAASVGDSDDRQPVAEDAGTGGELVAAHFARHRILIEAVERRAAIGPERLALG